VSQVAWNELEADDDAWQTTWSNGNTQLHVVPAGDLLMHDEVDCACQPYVEDLGEGDTLYAHNPWDGRPVT